MLDQIIALLIDESKWLTASMGLALFTISLLLFRIRHSEYPAQRRVLAAMNLFFGVMIGMMAFGHLLAVTLKLSMGTLQGSLVVFYGIGLVLAVPSWWLIYHSQHVLTSANHGRKTLVLNIWLAITLLALGLHNLPLAAPAFFNASYQLNSHRMIGWAIVSLAIVINAGLFIGSLVFLASGQSFEQFRGIE